MRIKVAKYVKKCLGIAASLMLVASLLPLSPAMAADFPLSPGDDEVADAIEYLRDAQGDDGSIGGFGVSAWVVMAIAAAGENPLEWKTAPENPSIVDYLRDNSDQLDWDKATDLERSILAIAAADQTAAEVEPHSASTLVGTHGARPVPGGLPGWRGGGPVE